MGSSGHRFEPKSVISQSRVRRKRAGYCLLITLAAGFLFVLASVVSAAQYLISGDLSETIFGQPVDLLGGALGDPNLQTAAYAPRLRNTHIKKELLVVGPLSEESSTFGKGNGQSTVTARRTTGLPRKAGTVAVEQAKKSGVEQSRNQIQRNVHDDVADEKKLKSVARKTEQHIVKNKEDSNLTDDEGDESLDDVDDAEDEDENNVSREDSAASIDSNVDAIDSGLSQHAEKYENEAGQVGQDVQENIGDFASKKRRLRERNSIQSTSRNKVADYERARSAEELTQASAGKWGDADVVNDQVSSVEDPMQDFKNYPDYVITDDNFEAIVASACNEKRELIFTTFSIMRVNGSLDDDFEFGMTAFNVNWVWHLNRAGIEKFLLIGMDENSCAPSRKMGILCYVNTFDWLEDEEIIKGRQVALKWLYLKKMVDLAFHPVFLDNDVAVIQNPIPLWNRSFDIEALSDARPADGVLPGLAMDIYCGVGKSYGGQHFPCTSTGAMFIRSTVATKAFLQTMVVKVEDEGPNGWEQAIFQQLILPFLMQVGDNVPPLRLRILPIESYHNAGVLNIRNEAGLPSPSVLVHCGYVYGGFRKRRALKRLKLWHEVDM